MKLGITGHQRLADSEAWPWVRIEIDRLVGATSHPLIGLSSLAVGADQIFAESILQHGGRLQAIIPFEGYEMKFANGYDRQTYDCLLKRAEITVLPKPRSDEEGYYAAGRKVVELADTLVAVWDGKPAAGLGGTGDVVKYATRLKKQVVWINPLTKAVSAHL
jgi:hypothetical protein